MRDIHANAAHTAAWVKDQQDTTKWKRGLPDVAIKSYYLSHSGPEARGENGRLRARWPNELKGDQVNLASFEHHLGTIEGKRADWAEKLATCVGRVLGSLEVVGAEPPPSVASPLGLCF